MNNIEDMQKSFEGQKFKVFSPFKCDISKNEDGNYVDDTTIFAFAWFCRGIASQAQQTESKCIRVDEQLPEFGVKVILMDDDDPDSMKFAILVDLWGRKLWKLLPDCNTISLHQYTHWMLCPLPPAPEGVDK